MHSGLGLIGSVASKACIIMWDHIVNISTYARILCDKFHRKKKLTLCAHSQRCYSKDYSLVKLELPLFEFTYSFIMGARRGARGALAPPPLGFEKMTSYAAVLQNILKFSLAPSALALYTLYFSLKCREKTQKFSFAPLARRKMVDFLYGAPKTCRLFKVSVILPPSGKISAGAHGTNMTGSSYRTYTYTWQNERKRTHF